MIGAERRRASLHRLRQPHTSSGDLHGHAQLRPLLVLGQHIAFLGRGKAALRGHRELIERGEFRGLVDAALDVVLLFERPELGADEAEHHDLVAFGQEPQRLEAAGALGVVFEEIAVVIAARKQALRHRLVAARRDPGRAEIAAADMGGDGHVGGLARERLVDDGGVGFLQVIDIDPAVARLLHLDVGAQIRPGGVVELQIAAAGVVEGAHRLAIGRGRDHRRWRRGRDRRPWRSRRARYGNAARSGSVWSSSA